jgi:hypothetical protein
MGLMTSKISTRVDRSKGVRLRRVTSWLLLSLLLLPLTSGVVATGDGSFPASGADDPQCGGSPCEVVAVGTCKSSTTSRSVVGFDYSECTSSANQYNRCFTNGVTVIKVDGSGNAVCVGGIGNKCSFHNVAAIYVHGINNIVCSGGDAVCTGNVDLTIHVSGAGNTVCSHGHHVCESTVVTIINSGLNNRVCDKGPITDVSLYLGN